MLDSQTVKASAAPGGDGFDAAKKIKGRKRHVAVDTNGRLLMVNLTTAEVQDAAGAERIVTAIRKRWPWRMGLVAPRSSADVRWTRITVPPATCSRSSPSAP